MKIAVIGGGASGMTTAYLLDQQQHQVTVFERQPMLGGHIRTLTKNVQPNLSNCDRMLECGVLEFPTVFHSFVKLMQELDVELKPINVGSALFPKDGSRFLSGATIDKNYQGFQKLLEYLRFDLVHASSVGLWLEAKFAEMEDFYDQPMSKYVHNHSISNIWLKLLTMYSYSMPFELIDDFPAELAMPMLRDYIAVKWLRVEGGVYSYIEKMLERFKGEIVLNADIQAISRSQDGVSILRSQGQVQQFDRVVFATPPDQVLALLSDPTDAEVRRFAAWQANHMHTVVHCDSSIYDRHDIHNPSEFDFFQTDHQWGYNSYLNDLCGFTDSEHYFLSFQLEDLIAKERLIHKQEHHTPLYTTAAFRYRDEVVKTNGENNTYHAGAYLGDGLHEGAIASAFRVAELFSS
jgi:predicted NAD/FAD-binding protein